jgi:membrane-associated phospholipid phosphatase
MVVWLGLLIWSLLKKWWKVSLGLMLLPLALAIEVFGKVAVFHPGPPHMFYRGVINFSLPSSYVPVDYSYPSGHLTRTTFLVVFLIFFLNYKSRVFQSLKILGLLILFGSMFISRIYLGEHWLSDVIGGSLIGSAFGLFAGLAVSKSKDSVEL